MRVFFALLGYLPHFIWLAIRLIPFHFYRKSHTEKESCIRAYGILKEHCHVMMRALKLNPHVSGQENIPKYENVVFIGNHQGIFDVIMVLAYVKGPTLFIAKEELKKFPVYGKWIENMGSLFLDRMDAREGLRVINEAAQRIKKDDMDGVIYPEGTRSRSNNMAEFQKGSFKLAQKAGVRVVPFAVDDTFKVLESGGINLGIPVYLNFLPPVDVTNLTKEEGRVIHHKVQQMVQDELNNMREERGFGTQVSGK